MAKVKGGLGKGLNALIPDNTMETNNKAPAKGDVCKINIHEISPNRNQPRKNFDKEKLDILVESIKSHGVIQPIVVRSMEKGYEIVAGERRWRASREAGLKEIPCIIKELDDQLGMEIALIENLQRENLNPIEEASAYRMLIETYQLTQEEIAQAVGKSRPYVANTVRLLNLDESVKMMVIDEKITSGHARTLLRIENPQLQKELGERISANNLSVRETEELISSIFEKKEMKKKEVLEKDHTLYYIEESLKGLLGTKVNIVRGKKKGKIEIEYYNDEDLERLVELLQSR